MERRRLLAFLVLLGIALGLYYFYSGLYSGITGEGHVDKTVVEPGGSIKVGLDRVYGVYDNPHTVSYSEDSSTGWCNTDNQYGSYYCMSPVSVTSWWEDQVCYSPDYSYMVAVVQKSGGTSGISFDPTYDDFGFKEYFNPTFGSSTGVLVYGLTSSRTASIHPFADTATLTNARIEFKMELRWYDTANRVAKPFAAVCVNGSSSSPYLYFESSDNGSSSSGYGTFSWTGPDGRSYTCYAQVVSPSSSTWDNIYFYTSYLSGRVYFLLGTTCWLAARAGYPSAGSCANNNLYTMKLRLNSFKMLNGKVQVELQQWDNIGSFSGFPYYSCTYKYSPGAPPNGGCTPDNPTDYTFNVNSNAPEGTYQFSFHVENLDYCHFASEYPEPYGTSQTGGYLDGTQFQVVNYADTVTINSVSVSNSDDEISSASITVSGGTTFDSVTVSSSCGGSKTINKSSFSCSGTTCTWSGTLGFDTSTSGRVTSPSTSCTVTASLIVNGSTRDTDSRSVAVYFPDIQNLVANDSTSASVSYSFTACGAFSKYKVYIDNQYVTTKTLTPPSSPGQCRSVSDSVSSSLITPGSHTLTIRLYTSDEGEYDEASDTFNANYTYSYTITTFNVSTPEKDVQGATSDTFSGSIAWTTTDPSGAYLAVKEGTTILWDYTASSSGSTTWSANLSCGTHTLTAVITPPSNHSDVKDSKTATATLYCWNASIGPSGTVQIPSSGGIPLPTAHVDVYYDVSSNPQTDYNVQVLWNSTDITSKFSPCSGHTACASLTASDVPMNCGQNVTLTLKVFRNSTQVASATSNITLQCVEQYVIIRSPTDGSAYDTYGSADVPDDFQLPVAVDYAGGNTLKFYIDDYNNEVIASPADCNDLNLSADACFTIAGTYLHRGDNTLLVRLYDNNTLIASDQKTFTVYAWSFAYTPSFTGDTGLISVKEYGSHAQSCEINFPELNVVSPMTYSDATSTWDFPVDKATYDGKSFTITCYSPTGAIAYTHSDTVNFASGGGGAGGGAGGGGGGGTYTPPKQPEKPAVVPYWPDFAIAGPYKWTVLDKDVFQKNFDSASVSETLVCVKPKVLPVSARYCSADIPDIPKTASDLKNTLDAVRQCSSVEVKTVGDLKCAANEGPGVYVFQTPDGEARIMVAGSPKITLNYIPLAVGAVAFLLFLYAYTSASR